ncbi:hypothetical protein GCM10027413_21860 [Conyzicola nivalis]|uniref:Uncharacterized protein n=2 Tax=Conyzicola nivalis TaxID=1477021 RepID=A0A916WFL4_9MICO|nr:hypothetical protein GCM10010979_04760 [Conyzicola nivalis]
MLFAGVITAAVIALDACASPSETPSSPSPTPTVSSTPSPTAEPVRPTLDELRLTADGLGDLVVGEPVPETPPDLAIVAFDPRGCISEESTLVEGEPGAGFWRPSYPEDRPFQVVTEGRVQGTPIINIQVGSESVLTDTGIGIGSGVDEVLAAYPGITVMPGALLTLVYVVEAPEGTLAFEIANPAGSPEGYWEPEQLNTVAYMVAYAPGQSVSAVYATDTAGACTV